MSITKLCDYCGQPALYTDSAVVYGRIYGMIYYCPPCHAWVGVHRGTGTVNGKDFTHLHVWVGSSKYDTREMSVFIDGIVQEARDLGIDTDTPEQIARFMAQWGEK
jgi:hypothetical protein